LKIINEEIIPDPICYYIKDVIEYGILCYSCLTKRTYLKQLMQFIWDERCILFPQAKGFYIKRPFWISFKKVFIISKIVIQLIAP